MYRYADAGVSALDPTGSVATTYSTPPAGGPTGVVKVNESGVRLLIVSEALPNFADVELAKSDPETSTLCPPRPDPEEGVSDETVGPANVYRAMYVSQQLFAGGQPVPVSPCASADTTHTSVGWSASCTAP